MASWSSSKRSSRGERAVETGIIATPARVCTASPSGRSVHEGARPNSARARAADELQDVVVGGALQEAEPAALRDLRRLGPAQGIAPVGQEPRVRYARGAWRARLDDLTHARNR